MIRVHPIRTAARSAAIILLTAAVCVMAQETPHGWPTAAAAGSSTETQRQESASPYTMPAQLTVKPGIFIAVRVDQMLSSDQNQPGDAFSATLVQPIVVDGLVVAQRGQVVGGRVAEAREAGRVEGVSRLALELTELTFVDGQQARIHSQLVSLNGRSSAGRDAAAVGSTTAMGAMIGAAADWGTGAAIGAGIGAAAGAIGVLATRGHPTVIYPESVLTFRLQQPVFVSTERAPQAFRYVDPSDYERTYTRAEVQPRTRPGCAGFGCAPPWPYYPDYYYGPGWAPYYWGPSFSFFYGPRFLGPPFYGRVMHYRRGYRR